MNGQPHSVLANLDDGQPKPVAAAKARLLAWAAETDARTAKVRSGISAMASGGVLAAVVGLLVSRLLTPRGGGGRGGTPVGRVAGVGTRLVSWALVVRVGTWLLPLALRAVQRTVMRRALN